MPIFKPTTFKADVPLSAERLATCSACRQTIGWFRVNGKPYPVEAKGYAGLADLEGAKGEIVQGITYESEIAAVAEPPKGTPARTLKVVFPRHFCPRFTRLAYTKKCVAETAERDRKEQARDGD